MNDPDQAALAAILLDSGAVRFGTFTLTSGRTSDVYVDVKRAATSPERLRRIAEALAARVGPATRLAGLELGAVPLTVATALVTGLPYLLLRKSDRTHGTRSRIEGELAEGDRVVLIEDVTTTGGSSADSVALLRGAGARVDRVVCVVDRAEGARERLAELQVELVALTSLPELRKARA